MVVEMYCYVCALAQQTTPAVATCKICSVGLCMQHHAENEQRSGPGGMSGYACLHRSSDLSAGHRVKQPRELGDSLERVRAVLAGRRRRGIRAPGLGTQAAGQH